MSNQSIEIASRNFHGSMFKYNSNKKQWINAKSTHWCRGCITRPLTLRLNQGLITTNAGYNIKIVRTYRYPPPLDIDITHLLTCSLCCAILLLVFSSSSSNLDKACFCLSLITSSWTRQHFKDRQMTALAMTLSLRWQSVLQQWHPSSNAIQCVRLMFVTKHSIS